MYAKVMTTRQISETIEDIYGFEVTEAFVSGVTDKVLPLIEEWQNRLLDEIYSIVYIDAIHQRSVFPSGQSLLKALYLATNQATKKWKMPIRN